ncbi:DNA N(6)-methyladenine demethylase ALKBH1C-like [Apium graveolens]|uniref:DNA N(6)-methyladenine demethylase ALKBH1C-like n=1 Tax=Apium graveolens TaxID=4045 RepID=UPI003D7AFFA9
MMNRGRGRGRGRGRRPTHASSRKVWRPVEPSSSPSTPTTANTKPSVGGHVFSDDSDLDGKGNKCGIHENASPGSCANDKFLSVGSTCTDCGKLKQLPVPVEGLSSFKNVIGRSACQVTTSDRQLPTPSNYHTQNNLNLHQQPLSQIPKSQEKDCSSEKVFDICLNNSGALKLKPSLHALNRGIRNQTKLSLGPQAATILRPGMLLLNNFISLKDQVEIVQTCRKLGIGNGGFYQPGYGDGAKMHLKMMCLGKNWDPQTSLYQKRRPVDGAEPPPIPSEFHKLVQKAIQYAHAYLLEEVGNKNVESVLPSMIPDICIVNFYTSSGRLGLHKDKDESQESLNTGLPVVSISIGDSAEFLYGDQMDIDKAEKVVLKSGDVLIFGGKSRHVYHGVASILTKNSTQALLQETNLRPGRLNLTFRKY